MVFPTTVAGFNRVDIAQFEQGRADIGVAYDFVGAAGSIAGTVYLRPSPHLPTVGLPPDAVAAARTRACDAAFRARLADIRTYNVARLIEERPVTLRQDDQRRPGKLAVLGYSTTFAGRRQKVRTELAAFCHAGGWDVEFRFTYPDGMDATDWISAFMRGFRWTGQPAA